MLKYIRVVDKILKCDFVLKLMNFEGLHLYAKKSNYNKLSVLLKNTGRKAS